jgi:uncharacterized protein involved in response to NO
VVLWIAGRVLVATPYAVAAAVVDVAFPLAVAASIAVTLLGPGNRRNYFFIALLGVLAMAALVLHLSALDVLPWPPQPVLRVVLDLLLFIMAVMGGRVIPMFTNNGVPGTQARRHPVVEKLALGGIVVLAAVDALLAPAGVIAVLAIALAIVHGIRLALWQPWRTVRTPLGMMTRTARGHTGRPLVADRSDVACYVLVMLAALVRVGGGMALPSQYVATLVVAGACWSLAFIVYFVSYAPYLTRARVDGKPG